MHKRSHAPIFGLTLLWILFFLPNSFAQYGPQAEILPHSAWVLDFPGPFREHSPPESDPRDFMGRVCMHTAGFHSDEWAAADYIAPVEDVTVTITQGRRKGEQVITDEGGYYHFRNVAGDALYLRVEREYLEPKEVIVYRSRPTVLQEIEPNRVFDAQWHERKRPNNAPGIILVGIRWPDAVHSILETEPMPHDLMFIVGIGGNPEGYRGLPARAGGFYAPHIVAVTTHPEEKNRIKDRILFHELSHARQHAVAILHAGNSHGDWNIDWRNSPEGESYAEAVKRDLQEIPSNELIGWLDQEGNHHSVSLLEGAAEFCAIYWALLDGRIGAWLAADEITRGGGIRVRAPNRYKWAEKHLNKKLGDTPVLDNPVLIPDKNLAAVIREELGLASGEPITQLDMLLLKKLDAFNRQIANLTGIEHASYLQVLVLSYNQIRDITPLTHLKGLSQLHLNGIRISDIRALSGLTTLWSLYLSSNQISDITPLAHLKKLVHLGLNNNRISDITPLAKLTYVEYLSVENNQIRDVRPLAELTNLKELKLYGNPIKDREPLLALLRKNPDVKIYLKEGGEPLPVTLSHFRAELTDAGVLIKWATESELDNAGFYIYRSETKAGEFKIVNPRLIQGAGTTSQRNTYTWTDTTAKPNTVYYYRIEDVSHAGDRKQLATVRLRGLVSASGKLRTQWSRLKANRSVAAR